MVTRSTSILAVSDILATLQFYKDVLGFESSWTYGEPPIFGAVIWGPVTIMFSLQPELAAKVFGHQHAINTEAVDDLYAMHLQGGAKVVSLIENKPWGIREYIVEDLNGYHLRVSGPIVNPAKLSSAFPEGVSIIRRLPTLDEFEKVTAAAFGRPETTLGVIDRTWKAVIALSPAGETIGIVRIVYDSPGWFSVWDVGVLPEWQGQRIGQRMMEEAMKVVQEECPGAWVYLFTYKPGFYEKLGFTEGSVTMRKV